MRAACCEATVLRHEVIAEDIRLLTVLWPDREHIPHAGQFFTLRAWGADEAPFLSRPISVHKWDAETQTVEFLYAVVGEGTRKLTALMPGDSFQLTGPMGNGFDTADLLSRYKKIAVVGCTQIMGNFASTNIILPVKRRVNKPRAKTVCHFGKDFTAKCRFNL